MCESAVIRNQETQEEIKNELQYFLLMNARTKSEETKPLQYVFNYITSKNCSNALK